MDGIGVVFTQDGRKMGTLLAMYHEFWLYERPNGDLALLSAINIDDGKD